MTDRRKIELPDGALIWVPPDIRQWVIDALFDEWEAAVDRESACEACAGVPPTEQPCSGCGEMTDHRIDGDLLADVIAEACPDVLSTYAARGTAERALARLAATPGVTVVRGPDSKPWTPEPVVDAHICCEHAP